MFLVDRFLLECFLADFLLCTALRVARWAEMEMVRESRERDKQGGVDRNACVVDRNQFFNTQVNHR